VPTRRQLAEAGKVIQLPEARLAVSKEGFADWVTVIAERSGTDPARDLYPHLVAAVIRAVVEAAIDAYVSADRPVSITNLLRRGFADVVAGLTPPPAGGAAAQPIHISPTRGESDAQR
jgi:hypothetical protein